jgi:periplasmic protein TonB
MSFIQSSTVFSVVLHGALLAAVFGLSEHAAPPEIALWEVALVSGGTTSTDSDGQPAEAPPSKPAEVRPRVTSPPVIETRAEVQPKPVEDVPAPLPQAPEPIRPEHSEPQSLSTEMVAEAPPPPAQSPTPLAQPAETQPEPHRSQTAAIEPKLENSPSPQSNQIPVTEPITTAAPPQEQRPASTSHAAPVDVPQASGKADYGWLAEALWGRVEKSKRYPYVARMNNWQGKVIVRAVIREDGHLIDLDVARSSGHSVLDDDAIASVKQAFPLKLPRSLGRTQVALHIPINYQLDR